MAASNIVVSIDEYMGITAGIISAYQSDKVFESFIFLNM